MKSYKKYSLKSLNTFGIDVKAEHFAPFSSADDLEVLLAEDCFARPSLVLGGGSNILLTQTVSSVLKNEVKGIEVVEEDEEYFRVKVGAGENWHQFVLYCIDKGWAGIENLSLIPGNVGASPMQNIGAYGVEIKDVFHSLEAFHIQDKEVVTFYKKDCHFGYRESVFKKKHKDQFVILNVTFRLNKKPHFNTSYGAIQQELEKMGIKKMSIRAISDAVINIRSSKLPNPKEVGSAGSFFKNPIIEKEKLEELKKKHPNIRYFPFMDNFKLAAGWLIEQCGWKGYRRGDLGVYPRQSLVLVNYGEVDGKSVYQLSEEIKQSVFERFDVNLEREVNLIG
ncbi:MAG TPA: UDP-N-acetylmuramate dehydrogenase [Chitinophagaceae bacterium]|nr:UDP-N-acetylmuramate dehydrogenase [Chitinophagaceae bacterium]